MLTLALGLASKVVFSYNYFSIYCSIVLPNKPSKQTLDLPITESFITIIVEVIEYQD